MEEKFGKTERIQVCSSCAVPIIRGMVEGQDRGEIDVMADGLCELIRKAAKI